MGLNSRKDKIDYWHISQGALRKKCDENDPLGIKREYTTKDGEKKEVYEIVYDDINGYIRSVELRDGDYGEQLIVYIDDVDAYALQMSWDSSEAQSFAEKLKSVDISKEVNISPYHFTPKDSTKVKRGITITQDGKKLDSYFLERDDNGKIVGSLHGLPEPEGDTSSYDSDDWKVYYIKRRKFLKNEVILAFPSMETDGKPEVAEKPTQVVDNEADDLPF